MQVRDAVVTGFIVVGAIVGAIVGTVTILFDGKLHTLFTLSNTVPDGQLKTTNDPDEHR